MINFLTLPKLAPPVCAFKKAKCCLGRDQGGGWGEGTMKWLYFCCLIVQGFPNWGPVTPQNNAKTKVGLISTMEYTALEVFVRRHLMFYVVLWHKVLICGMHLEWAPLLECFLTLLKACCTTPLDTWPLQLRRNMRSADIRALCLHNVYTFNTH